MMTDLLMWAPINLGRWFGTQVRVHILLILFVVTSLLNAAIGQDEHVVQTAAWLVLLLAALAIHELAHAATAWWLGVETEDVRLWPLGNMVVPSIATRSGENLLVVAAGPAANALLAVGSAVVLAFSNAQFVWNPFGNPTDSGAPLLLQGKQLAAPLTSLWWIGWFGYLNYILVVLNIPPALPFDGGRAFRALLANSTVSQSKDSYYALWTAHTSAALLVIVGVIRLISGHGDGLLLMSLALPIELIVRSEARTIDDGGFFEEGVFGYDFSEGYTSLEGSAAKVRPYYRESAIKRWRRRRSESRRQRRQAREAAEEQRMDEILEKLHREGRHALTDEEHRFLLRVSVKYRNRPRAGE
jgi:Zn-dependent protease